MEGASPARDHVNAFFEGAGCGGRRHAPAVFLEGAENKHWGLPKLLFILLEGHQGLIFLIVLHIQVGEVPIRPLELPAAVSVLYMLFCLGLAPAQPAAATEQPAAAARLLLLSNGVVAIQSSPSEAAPGTHVNRALEAIQATQVDLQGAGRQSARQS